MEGELVGPVLEGELIDESPCPECHGEGGCSCCGCGTCGLLGEA